MLGVASKLPLAHGMRVAVMSGCWSEHSFLLLPESSGLALPQPGSLLEDDTEQSLPANLSVNGHVDVE